MRRLTRGIVAMNIALSISHNHKTGLTFAILNGYSELQQAFIREQIKSMAPLARHPLFVPIIFMAHMQRLLNLERKRLWTELIYAETASGQTGAPIVNHRLYSEQIQDFGIITKDVLGVMQCASAWISHSEALLLAIEAIQESVDYMSSAASESRVGPPIGISNKLKESLKIIRHKSKVMLWDFQYFDKRAQAQMTAVYIFSNRDIIV